GCNSFRRDTRAVNRPRVVLIVSDTSSAPSSLPSHMYMDRPGWPRFTHAARYSSTSMWAMRLASSRSGALLSTSTTSSAVPETLETRVASVMFTFEDFREDMTILAFRHVLQRDMHQTRAQKNLRGISRAGFLEGRTSRPMFGRTAYSAASSTSGRSTSSM